MILRKIGLGSTARVTAAFAVVVVALVAAGAFVLYVIGGSFGIVKDVDRVAVTVFSDKHFHLTVTMFVAGAAALAAALSLLGVALALIGATIYNRIAVLTGGLSARLPAAASVEAQPERARRSATARPPLNPARPGAAVPNSPPVPTR